jgi:hypothetical protein
VAIRPLVGIAIFAAAIGPALAAKHGRARGLVARLMTFPLTALLTFVDLTATRLAQRRAGASHSGR